MITGSTRVCQIIGHPILQVRSPDLFNDFFGRSLIDAVLVPIDVAPANLRDFVAFARGWRNSPGFVVTVPHKRAVAGLVDHLSPRAARLQAVNVVRRDDHGRLSADMLDGLGFLAALQKNGFRAQGCRALVIGTGGAGSAIVDALCEAGIRSLCLQDIDPARVAQMHTLFATAFPHIDMPQSYDGLENFDLVVNASPAGMNGTGELPIAPALMQTLRPDSLVADVVTKPPMTPFLLAAQARFCRVQTGPEMTECQIPLLVKFLQTVPPAWV
jgi:shikimate dehydrogenase